MKTVFSGIQPSGNLHIGNYIGALKQWKEIQNNSEAIFCIVDLHAITVAQDPKQLKEKVLEVAALYMACGIDPNKSHIFVQSENPDHTYLAWILNTITSMGQLSRMTQFKVKSGRRYIKKYKKNGEEVGRDVITAEEYEKYLVDKANAGLFDYPVLMAADILLYQTDEVPVGEDQKQHIELTRDIAEKFNRDFGQTFKLPAPIIQKETSRIMSLSDPSKKMSKSDQDPSSRINLLDSEEEIREKIKKAVTDSNTSISKDNGPEAILNLLTIYASFNNQTLDQAYTDLNGKSYGEFKNVLADLVVAKLSEIQKKYNEIRNDESGLRKVLDEGKEFAIHKSSQTLFEVKQKMGLV
ncbi:MAG: tryptophan--tRNA ligase [Candidatus Levybacteria bacterium CG10_big_fil_rev_8_21_14_0_10_35_13]|nr:MAG: tryptophan--tRNA ligase [Candidatus Levybacteria bacterium CG10_big_fil_rev_8_21_14_0_10_35_13]